MSDYQEIEAALLAVVQKLSDYDTNNAVAGDYSVLDAGKAQWVVTTPGDTDSSEVNSGVQLRAITVIMDFGVLYNAKEKVIWAIFAEKRDDLIQHIEQYPTLDGETDVVRVRVGALDNPIAIKEDDEDADEGDAGPGFIYQQLFVAVVTNYEMTGGEYA